MKVFYGVQGTGNGHITRARSIASEMKKFDIEVDFLFSGRPVNKYFDMQVFGNYSTAKGVTFNISNGQVNLIKTGLEVDIYQLFKDINQLDLSVYDVVISDYEPITSWAAKQQNIPVVGIGHQYAFDYNIPKQGFNTISSSIMKKFAPTNIGVGLHWHHFDQPILPPIINTYFTNSAYADNKIVVYLPFENQDQVVKLLAPFTDFQFTVYAPDYHPPRLHNHIQYNLPTSVGFKNDLQSCAGVICNAGFELVSESLVLGKKLLVKPVTGQAEQCSNAHALEQLRYGVRMDTLNSSIVSNWLNTTESTRVYYPNVAYNIVERLYIDKPILDPHNIQQLWDSTQVH